MRVISLVPSLTETLIECGVEVVGRTRFCIHPAARVNDIPTVGGTKGVDWQRCESLRPDLVIFDREENLKAMAEACPYDWSATHVTSIESAGREIGMLAEKLNNAGLENLATQWQQLADAPAVEDVDWHNVPGQLTGLASMKRPVERVEYVIWRKPWMVVGPNTFIGSMLRKVGFDDYLVDHVQNYPELDESDMVRDDTFYLFSSEPYRFHKHRARLREQGFTGAVVDGEFYSWFGIRSLRAAQQLLNLKEIA